MTSAELPSVSPAPHLPLELLAQIVDEAAGYCDNLDYTTLRRLCLTSRSILPFARSALYRDIIVILDDADVDDLSDTEDGGFISNGGALQAALAQAPHLARWVTSLTLRWVGNREGAVELSGRLAGSFLGSCPKISSLRLENPYSDEQHAVLARVLLAEPNLVDLKIDCTPDLPQILTRLPRLRRLHLYTCEEFEADEEMAFPFELNSLQVSDGYSSIPSQIFDELVRCSAHSLRQLDLVFPDSVEQATSHLRQLSALSHLRLATERSTPLVLPDDLVEILPKCATLQSLQLGGPSFPPSQIPRLPPQLSAIYFETPVDREGVISLLADRSRGTLRQVIMARCWGTGNWEELGEEHGWSVERFGWKVKFAR